MALGRFNMPPAEAAQNNRNLLLIPCLTESIMKSIWVIGLDVSRELRSGLFIQCPTACRIALSRSSIDAFVFRAVGAK